MFNASLKHRRIVEITEDNQSLKFIFSWPSHTNICVGAYCVQHTFIKVILSCLYRAWYPHASSSLSWSWRTHLIRNSFYWTYFKKQISLKYWIAIIFRHSLFLAAKILPTFDCRMATFIKNSMRKWNISSSQCWSKHNIPHNKMYTLDFSIRIMQFGMRVLYFYFIICFTMVLYTNNIVGNDGIDGTGQE